MAHTDNNDNDAHPSHPGPAFGLGDATFILLLVAAMVAVVFSGRFAYREGALLETAKGNAQQFMKWAEAVSGGDGKAEPFTLALCASMPGEVPPEVASGVAPEGAAGLPAAVREGADGAGSATLAASGVVPVVAHAHGAAPAAEGDHAREAQGTQEAGEAPAAPKVATTWATCREALFTAGGPLSRLSNPFDATIPVASSKCERRNRATRGVVHLQKGTQPPLGVPGGTTWSPLEDEEPMVRGLLLKVQACDAGGYPINIGEVKL